MGNDSSRIWSVFELLDVNHDGRLSQQEIEDWFKDEQFVGNPLFDQSINGFQSLPDLTRRFIRHVRRLPHQDGALSPSNNQDSLSFDDLRAYCSGLSDKDISHLTMSLSPTKARKDFALKQVFDALDVNRNGYLDAPEIEILLAHLDDENTLSPEARQQLKEQLVFHESNKVVFSDVERFFADWPLRAIRTKTEKLREHAKFVRAHSQAKPHRKKTMPIESIDPADKSSLLALLADYQAEVDELIDLCLRLHTDSINANAAKRSINEDAKMSDQLLIKLDKERLVQANRLTDIQLELTGLHKLQQETGTRRSLLETRIEELNKKIAPANEFLSKLHSDSDSVKEELRVLQDDMLVYQGREKNIPPKNKAIATTIGDLQTQLHSLEKNLLDVQQLIPIFEKEFTAIRKQMDDDRVAGKSITALEIRHKNAVENKYSNLRKSEEEYINQHHQLQQAINKAASELNGDDETQQILSKLNDLRKQTNDRRDILMKFHTQSLAVQKDIAAIEAEQKSLASEVKNCEKKERVLQQRVAQQTDLYSDTERALQALNSEKEAEALKFKELIRQHDQLSEGYATIEVELRDANEAINGWLTKQEEAEMKLNMTIEEPTLDSNSNINTSGSGGAASTASGPANRELLDFLQMPTSDSADGRLGLSSSSFSSASSKASSANSSPALLPKAASVLQAHHSNSTPSLSTLAIHKPKYLPIVASIDCEFNGRRTHGVINISQYLLRYESAVPLNTQQHAEEGARLCIDVTDMIDLRINAGAPVWRETRSASHSAQANSQAQSQAQANFAAATGRRSATNTPPKTQSALAAAGAGGSSAPMAMAASAPAGGFFGSLLSSIGEAFNAPPATQENAPAGAPLPSSAAPALPVARPVDAASSSAPTDPAHAHHHSPSVFTFDSASAASSSSDQALASSVAAPSSGLVSAPSSSSASSSRRFSFLDSASLFTLTIILRAGYRNRFLFNAEGDHSANSVGNVSTLRFIGPDKYIRRIYSALKSSIQTATTVARQSLSGPAGAVRGSLSLPSSPIMGSAAAPAAAALPSLPHDEPVSLTVAASESILLDAEAERLRRLEEAARAEEREEIYVDGESEITTTYCLKKIIRATPDRYHLTVWKMVYSMTVHGVSFNQFISIIQDYPAAVLVFRDAGNKVFGGYASAPFISAVASQGTYYGTGESFVFDIRDRECGVKSVFLHRWTGENDYFMFSGDNFIAMGGGAAFAWQVDQSFKFGTSGVCSTFDSPILSSQPNFSLLLFEVWCPTRDHTASDFL